MLTADDARRASLDKGLELVFEAIALATEEGKTSCGFRGVLSEGEVSRLEDLGYRCEVSIKGGWVIGWGLV